MISISQTIQKGIILWYLEHSFQSFLPKYSVQSSFIKEAAGRVCIINIYIYIDKTKQRWAMEEDERKMIPHWSLSYYALLLQRVEWDGKDNEHNIIYFETQRSGLCLLFSPAVGHWLTHIPILPRRPLWARFSHASNLTFHLTRPRVPSCIVEIMFLLLVLQ